MTDKVQKIKEYLVGMAGAACCDAKTKKVIKANILPFIDSLQEEPVSEDLEDFAGKYGANAIYERYYDKEGIPVGIGAELCEAVIVGANWQRQKNQKWIDDNRQQIFNEGYKNGSYAGRYDMYNKLFEAASTDRVVTHFLLAHSV